MKTPFIPALVAFGLAVAPLSLLAEPTVIAPASGINGRGTHARHPTRGNDSDKVDPASRFYITPTPKGTGPAPAGASGTRTSLNPGTTSGNDATRKADFEKGNVSGPSDSGANGATRGGVGSSPVTGTGGR